MQRRTRKRSEDRTLNAPVTMRASGGTGVLAILASATAPAAAHADSPSTALSQVHAFLGPSVALAAEAALLAIVAFAVLALDRRAARRVRNALPPLTVTRRSGVQVVVPPPRDVAPLWDAPPPPVYIPPAAPASATPRVRATPAPPAVPSGPAPAESESEQCRIEWSPASAGARFRAVGTNRAGRRYVAGRSAIVVSGDGELPSRDAETLAAYEQLVERLMKQGWSPTPSTGANSGPWYAQTMQRPRPRQCSTGPAASRPAGGSAAR
jgi:hypothetical protein